MQCYLSSKNKAATTRPLELVINPSKLFQIFWWMKQAAFTTRSMPPNVEATGQFGGPEILLAYTFSLPHWHLPLFENCRSVVGSRVAMQNGEDRHPSIDFEQVWYHCRSSCTGTTGKGAFREWPDMDCMLRIGYGQVENDSSAARSN